MSDTYWFHEMHGIEEIFHFLTTSLGISAVASSSASIMVAVQLTSLELMCLFGSMLVGKWHSDMVGEMLGAKCGDGMVVVIAQQVCRQLLLGAAGSRCHRSAGSHFLVPQVHRQRRQQFLGEVGITMVPGNMQLAGKSHTGIKSLQ